MLRGFILIFSLTFVLNTSNATTLAISYFDNNSGISKYNSLSKGIADMLITDLSKLENITIVEREKLESLLNEIKLGQTKYFDPQTAQKLGKGLGAESILTGAFLIVDNMLRIDARLIDVETSQIIMAEQVSGITTDFFRLHAELVNKLSKSLKIPRQQINAIQANFSPVDVDAVVAYSDAIDANDQGLSEDALNILENTVKEYPEFIQAKSKLDKLKTWMLEAEKKREELLEAENARKMKELSLDDPKLGTSINNHWGTLISSNNYTQLLFFNQHLKKLGINSDEKMFGEASPLTFGEMMLYYDCIAYTQLKKHDEVINNCILFIDKYPTSLYYSGVKASLDGSMKEIELRREGKAKIEETITKKRFEIYTEYLDRWDMNYISKFINEEKKKEFGKLCRNEIIDHLKNVNNPPEDFDFYDLEDLFEIAKSFGQTDLMQELVEVAFHLYSGTDDEEYAYSLLEDLNEYEEEEIDRAEKKQYYEQEIQSKPIEEYHKLLQSTYQIRKCGMNDELYELSVAYLKYSEENKPSEAGKWRKSAWDNIFTYCSSTGNIDTYQNFLDRYKEDSICKAYLSDQYPKKLREYEQDLRELKSEENRYREDFLIYPLQLKYNLELANIYRECHQYLNEIKVRSKLVKEYPLDEESLGIQYYGLFIAYRDYGLFDEARKIHTIMQQKLPKNLYTSTINDLISFMPK